MRPDIEAIAAKVRNAFSTIQPEPIWKDVAALLEYIEDLEMFERDNLATIKRLNKEVDDRRKGKL